MGLKATLGKAACSPGPRLIGQEATGFSSFSTNDSKTLEQFV